MVLSLESALSPIQSSGSEAELLPGGARLKGEGHTPLNLVKATVLPALLSLLAQGRFSRTNLVQAFPSVHWPGLCSKGTIELVCCLTPGLATL